MPELTPGASAILRHDHVAFQFSGGKDSTAALFLLRDFWPSMTVYWLNSGDSFPETAEFIRSVAASLPRFVEVAGRVNETIAAFGPPSDLIPYGASEAAWAMGVGSGPQLQDRSLCCARSKMVPLHQHMIDDGITLIVRGQKSADDYRGPFQSGQCADGFEFYYPIEQWSDSDVMALLSGQGLLPPLYGAGLTRSGDCMRCSAWLGDRRANYLAEHHPLVFKEYRQRVFGACAAVEKTVAALFGEAVVVAGADADFTGGADHG